MGVSELFAEGRLHEAIEELVAEVKGRPADADRRGLLAVLLCYAGDLERADRQLDALGRVAPETEVGVALMRQLLRAEMWRQEFHRAGRLPSFLGKPDAACQRHLRASVLLRDGDGPGARAELAAAEEARRELSGQADGAPFDDFRDLDDLTASLLEVLTSTGKFYWIPLADVQELVLHPPERTRDLLWRRVTLSVADGPEGDVYLPALYAPLDPQDEEPILLGRKTDWSGDPEGGLAPMRGRGLRTFLVGQEARTVHELRHLVFDPPADGA